ncbi:MAG: hypothetical protein ACRC8Y_09440 [Chroococcales cyanobacterium]
MQLAGFLCRKRLKSLLRTKRTTEVVKYSKKPPFLRGVGGISPGILQENDSSRYYELRERLKSLLRTKRTTEVVTTN